MNSLSVDYLINSFTRLRRKPRLSVLSSSLLRRMDKAVGLHKEEVCHRIRIVPSVLSLESPCERCLDLGRPLIPCILRVQCSVTDGYICCRSFAGKRLYRGS